MSEKNAPEDSGNSGESKARGRARAGDAGDGRSGATGRAGAAEGVGSAGQAGNPDGPGRADRAGLADRADRSDGARIHRGAVTAGTAPAVGRGRAVASPQDADAARRQVRAVDRRGALFGLLTAGAAVVVGAAVGCWGSGVL